MLFDQALGAVHGREMRRVRRGFQGPDDAQEHLVHQAAHPGDKPGRLLLLRRQGQRVTNRQEDGIRAAAGADHAVAACVEDAQQVAKLLAGVRPARQARLRVDLQDEEVRRRHHAVLAAVQHARLQNRQVAAMNVQLRAVRQDGRHFTGVDVIDLEARHGMRFDGPRLTHRPDGRALAQGAGIAREVQAHIRRRQGIR